MYNLLQGTDHDEFIKWRTEEHQKDNMAVPGVIKSDFYMVKEAWKREELPYRYMTEVYWPDMKNHVLSFKIGPPNVAAVS